MSGSKAVIHSKSWPMAGERHGLMLSALPTREMSRMASRSRRQIRPEEPVQHYQPPLPVCGDTLRYRPAMM